MARKKSSVSVAASAAGRPAERLAKKKMAERNSELRRADFQFQRLKRVDRGSRNRRRKTAPTERSVFCAEGGIFATFKGARASGSKQTKRRRMQDEAVTLTQTFRCIQNLVNRL